MKCTYQMEDRRHKREVSNGVGHREELNENWGSVSVASVK